MLSCKATRNAASMIIVFPFLFVLFPAEYVRQFSETAPFEPLDRLALFLTDFHVRNGLKYGCENPVYFGYKTPFGVEIPGVSSNEKYDFYTQKSEHLAYYFVSDVNAHLNWAVSGTDIETYNLMVLANCQKK